MYSTATHDRESSLTAPIISDRSNSSRRGGFLFEYVNEKKNIYIYTSVFKNVEIWNHVLNIHNFCVLVSFWWEKERYIYLFNIILNLQRFWKRVYISMLRSRLLFIVVVGWYYKFVLLSHDKVTWCGTQRYIFLFEVLIFFSPYCIPEVFDWGQRYVLRNVLCPLVLLSRS